MYFVVKGIREEREGRVRKSMSFALCNKGNKDKNSSRVGEPPAALLFPFLVSDVVA